MSWILEPKWTLRVLEAMIVQAQEMLDFMFDHLPLELVDEVDTLCHEIAVWQCQIEQQVMEASGEILESFVAQYKELRKRVRFTYECRIAGAAAAAAAPTSEGSLLQMPSGGSLLPLQDRE